MITIHRDYLLVHRKNKNRAHVQVNPVGHLDIEISDCQECYHSDFENLMFKKVNGKTKLIGQDKPNTSQQPWQLELSDRDAAELNHLIAEASEEYEVLMRDL